jgi:pimeloyl-ACP methyl ester carboxylesterase
MLPLILLPGMMCDARMFAPQVAGLAGRAVSVLPIEAHDTVAALAVDVLAAAPPRFALAGLSMGGIVAMEVLRQAPDRVARIALMDTNPLAERPEMQARRGPQIAAARAGRLREVIRDEMKPNYLAPGPRCAEVLDLCMAMALDLGPEVFVRQSLALRDRPDQQEVLRAVRVPALVLCGAGDMLCPLERHELMRDLIPGAVLRVIAGAAHLPTLEQPEAVTEAWVEWLEA